MHINHKKELPADRQIAYPSFTAVDSTEHKRIRIVSLEEYYHLCGYNTNKKCNQAHEVISTKSTIHHKFTARCKN